MFLFCILGTIDFKNYGPDYYIFLPKVSLYGLLSSFKETHFSKGYIYNKNDFSKAYVYNCTIYYKSKDFSLPNGKVMYRGFLTSGTLIYESSAVLDSLLPSQRSHTFELTIPADIERSSTFYLKSTNLLIINSKNLINIDYSVVKAEYNFAINYFIFSFEGLTSVKSSGNIFFISVNGTFDRPDWKLTSKTDGVWVSPFGVGGE